MTPLERDLDALNRDPGGPVALRLALQLAHVEIEALTGEVEELRAQVANLTVEADAAGTCPCSSSAWCPCGELPADDCGGWPFEDDGHRCPTCRASVYCGATICGDCGHLDDGSAGWRLFARWMLDYPDGRTVEREREWLTAWRPSDETDQHLHAFGMIDGASWVEQKDGAVIGPLLFRFERVGEVAP